MPHASQNPVSLTKAPQPNTPNPNHPASMSKPDKIGKIVARLKARIDEGQFYEAQQQTRVVAARHIKAANWDAAVDILHGVAQGMLKAGQGGSGGDLAIMMVDVYKQAEMVPDATNKGRLLTLLRLFSPEEPTRKKFINDMVAWSCKFGDYPAGDPELHHVAGCLYAEEREVLDAERHLIIGTKDSAEVLAKLHYTWYKENDSHAAAEFCARTLLPSLLVANLRAANTAYRFFVASLVADNPNLGVQEVNTEACEMMVFPSLPLLNFLGMLMLAVQRGQAPLFRQLMARYASHFVEFKDWDEDLEVIAEMYFGIKKPRQANPLLNMMGSLLGGGMGAQR